MERRRSSIMTHQETALHPWTKITPDDCTNLVEVIEQIHRAVQFVALVAKSYLPEKEDDSQANLGWESTTHLFTSRWIEGNRKFRIVLETTELVLELQDENEEMFAQIVLHDKKVEDVDKWLRSKLVRLGLNPEQLNLKPHYDLPFDFLQSNFVFDDSEDDCQEMLSLMRSNAVYAIEHFWESLGEEVEARTWPHHFDSAVQLKNKDDKYVSFGFAVPDMHRDVPYFYCNVWPYPKSVIQPELDLGVAHESGWKGTILDYKDVSVLPEKEQLKAVLKFANDSLTYLLKIN